MFELTPWRRREESGSLLPSPWALRREFDNLIERFFGEPERLMVPGTFEPIIDMYETDDAIKVVAEMPGLERDDFDINLMDDVLTIRGEKKHEYEQKGENFRRIERTFGSFTRTFTLPCSVREDKIEAHYKNGVLHLTLPKSEECKKKPLKITVQ
jgi:HSP20 family protein